MTMSVWAPMATSMLISSSSSQLPARKIFRTCCLLNERNQARIPMPPINPKDPFLSRLASVAATSPETLLNRPVDSEIPPFLEVFGAPKNMATSAHVHRPPSYRERRPRRSPPDLPSLLLHGRVVFIGMPLVPAVTELVIAELMYLQWMDPKEPIYVYINSTGTTRDDGETVATEAEGFAIYDAMMLVKNEIRTVCIGVAVGQACLLLAAGTKGKRYMFPNASAMIQQPRVPPSGLMPVSRLASRAKEVKTNKDTFVKLLAKHTGNSVERVNTIIKRGPYYMDAMKAKKFGVIDKIIWRGQEKLMAEVESDEELDKRAGIEVVDEF
ncbi:hypothetical protein K1719_033224 [Acacia pycnantha]|nr:hypothetical protein K1719_033224 [Acacia pycnantha]